MLGLEVGCDLCWGLRWVGAGVGGGLGLVLGLEVGWGSCRDWSWCWG